MVESFLKGVAFARNEVCEQCQKQLEQALLNLVRAWGGQIYQDLKKAGVLP